MTKPKQIPKTEPDKLPEASAPKGLANSHGELPKSTTAAPGSTAPATGTPAAGGTAAASTPPPGRKPLGAKEVIPFYWKLLGEAPGAVLTLFKATEKEEVDAHLERVEKEGYYTNLRVVELGTKVKQPKPPPASKTAGRRSRKTAKASKKVAVKIAKKSKPAPKAPSVTILKPSAKKSEAKPADKSKAKPTAKSKAKPVAKSKAKPVAKSSKKKAKSAKTTSKGSPKKKKKKKKKA